jgi:two-component system LytT family response regulator
MKLRALVIDDEELARKNLTMLLDEYCEGIDVIGQAGNIREGERKNCRVETSGNISGY